MQTTIESSANGVVIHIPERIAEEVGLKAGRTAEVVVEAGLLVIRSVAPATLSELLAGITEANLHGEWDTGAPVGNETL